MNRISCPRCNGTTITEKNKNGEQTCKACGLVFTTHLCPVCGDYEFSGNGSFDICEVCGWEDDPVQMELLDETNCANRMSLSQARKAWKADCNARIALRLLSNDLISYSGVPVHVSDDGGHGSQLCQFTGVFTAVS